MAFSLMRGFDRIQVVADLDPVAAARDSSLGERMVAYPKLFPAGSPDFGYAVQAGDHWRIGTSGGSDPRGSRLVLASHLRRDAKHEADPGVAERMRVAANRLDPEEGEPLAKDEWEIGDRRYRVIRIEKYTLIHRDKGMEPPRTTDIDPPDHERLLHGHLIDPLAPTGQWEAQLRLNLTSYEPIAGTIPAAAAFDAHHATSTHPGIVLLPPVYTVVEITSPGSWEPFTGAEGPGLARDHLAGYFSQLLPRLREFQGDPPTSAERDSWEAMAAQIRDMPGPDYKVADRHFRTVRVSRFLRLGPDGPEGLRPTDPDRYDDKQS